MRIELDSTLPYKIGDILEGLLLLRREQAEPRVQYVLRKFTPQHIVHELKYDTHMLLVPFVGANIVMREDIVIDGNTMVIKTYGENYQTKKVPYMVTEARYASDGDNTTRCSLLVEWAINKSGSLPKALESKLNDFGIKQHRSIQAREEQYIQKYLRSK